LYRGTGLAEKKKQWVDRGPSQPMLVFTEAAVSGVFYLQIPFSLMLADPINLYLPFSIHYP
jgi:hypothetical protein